MEHKILSIQLNGGLVAEWFLLIAAVAWLVGTGLDVYRMVLEHKIRKLKGPGHE